MLIKTKAIVLRSVKYGDQKIIVDFYTEAFGRLASAVKISTTAKGRMKKQFFQPLTMLTLEVDYRQRQQLQKLADVQILMPWTTLFFEPSKMTIGMFLAEVLCYTTRQEQQDQSLYAFLETSLQWLDTASEGIANFHIAFLVRLAMFLGFLPSHEDYQPGMLFDMRSGEFVSLTPLHRDFLRADDAARMCHLLRISYSTMHLFAMSRDDRQRCLEIILHFYRLHVPSFPELKSLQVLQEVYR